MTFIAICSGYNSPTYRLFGCQFLVGDFRNFLYKSLKLSGLFLFCTYCLLLPFLLPSPKAVPLHRQTTQQLCAGCNNPLTTMSEPKQNRQQRREFMTMAEISERKIYYGNIKKPISLSRLGVLLSQKGFLAVRRGNPSRRGWIVYERESQEINAERKLLFKN